ncbi:helix-turn-helix domain-containing protein [Gluconobacter thailandicus]|uniref:DUF4115 domain-containing protein n=1 Tax=Gluconobacter thailandicus TaxID=257438 RepID=A0AAP9EUM0_GLUTH|nr:helix-turn-helix domain-containing protein [Gluconobacter thailandicus]QEH97439.1 DUF4115 domain-containing protein [Gluconobacter thailandicus]
MSPPSDRMMPLRSDQPSVGTILRTRREELGWQIEDVAQWLRIRSRLLIALEADDLSSLPGVAYAVGFLRTYAHAMQLDADGLVARFRREYRGVVNRKTDLVFPQPEGERGLPVGLLVGAGLVVVVAAYAGWYRFASHESPADRRVPAVAELMPGAATPATTSPQVASVMPGRAPTPEPHVSQPPVPVSTPPAEAVPASPSPQAVAPALQAPPASTDMTSAAPATGSEDRDQNPSDQFGPSTDAPAETPAPAVPVGSVVVRVLAPVWMQVKDRDGHVLVARVLKAGESWQGDAAVAPFRMSFGNAGGVVLSTDGATSAPLGRQGEVRRNVEVTAEAIKSGAFGNGVALPAQPAPDASGSSAPSSMPEAGAGVPDTPAPVVKPVPHRAKAPAKPSAELSADDLNARQLDQSSPSH